MNAQNTSSGCGGGSCQCAGQSPEAVASVNGIALHEPGLTPDAQELKERAHTELLRQHAVKAGLLPRFGGLVAPELDEHARQVIEEMIEAEVQTPTPTPEECQRYYEAHLNQFVVGQALHVRHILFAVTPGVNVHALSLRAEKALLELSRKEVAVGHFAQLAAELSNCPTGATGGDLGWVAPDECAPELANELFFQSDTRWGMGVHPRLVHTRFGLHIIEVLGRRKGRQLTFEEAQDRVVTRLQMQARTRALRQYMSLLVGQAQIEGVVLEGADSPLVQ